MAKRCVLALVFLCAGFAAYAGQRPVIRVATHPGWPPMEFLDDSGELTGFSRDYLLAVAREGGFDVEFVHLPWTSLFAGLANGDYDIVCASLTITPERQEAMDFSLPYYEVRQALVTRSSLPVDGAESMAGRRIGVQTATTGHEAARRFDSAVLVQYESIIEAFTALAAGEIDGVVCDDPVAAHYVIESGRDGESLKVALIVYAGEPELYGFAVAKGNSAVLELVNRGIKRVHDKGIEAGIHRKWMGY